ncbi:MAG TPA: phosphoenolpyruvate carboxykinase (GTP) [Syntrophobacteria bacterium]|nr:phosphoenolpyruvate carboxykinase (GTP) [Syntrophobacteria bacterium]
MRWQATLQSRLSESDLKKLLDLNNPSLNELIARSILRYQPKSVFISTGSEADRHYIQTQALRLGEEKPLLSPGHTVHYDGYFDQGRDPGKTKFLLKEGTSFGPGSLCIERGEGIVEINEIMDGIMHGKEMIVSFYSLGPVGTEFEIPCVQVTDSYYVAHSEDILYRSGYQAFTNPKYMDGFFGFLHSAGVLKNGVSRDLDFRRIFVDLETNSVYSANTQYAGNTVAAKKLAHRLAIKKAAQEDWLAEHLLIAAVPSYEGDKVTYVTGAFPSWCGKTSTSMLFKVVGDDLAHLRKRDGVVYAANVEHGIFGVIKDVNPVDDPYIYGLLVKSGEIIFSNILDSDGRSYWQGMGDVQIPLRGHNHSGSWWRGKRDEGGKLIALSHDNARFTVGLAGIENFDQIQVVPCEGIIYGGRSAKRPVPVSQSYGWVHGVFYGATIESEPTAATVGGSGSQAIINPMANTEFLSIPIGMYLENHIRFGKDLKQAPKVFYVNYFLRDEAGKFLNTKMDKKVWVRWIERRINARVDAYATPIGFIPKHEDLAELFQKELGTAYHREDYQQQFMIRVRQLWDKLDGVEKFYRGEASAVPGKIFAAIDISRKLLLEAERRHGSDIPPVKFKDARFPAELAAL